MGVIRNPIMADRLIIRPNWSYGLDVRLESYFNSLLTGCWDDIRMFTTILDAYIDGIADTGSIPQDFASVLRDEIYDMRDVGRR